MPNAEFELSVPDDHQAGVYANVLTMWHTYHEFTLDFGVTMPPRVGEDPGGQELITVPGRVVARVRLPVSILLDIIGVINTNVAQYEEKFGLIRRPGDQDPLYPPEE